MNRRQFLKTAVVAAGVPVLSVPRIFADQATPPKLRIAIIGCGGQGRSNHVPVAVRQRLVALVDPDENYLSKALQRAREIEPTTDTSQIKTFMDYRKMFDVMGKELDAVIIAAQNHHHFLPAMMAMKLRIPVYLEKPLCHNIAETRALAAAARQYRIPTQMGNQGYSTESCRRLCEYIWAGAIGNITAVYTWCNRANGGTGPRPPSEPVPAGMHWDSWIGPAPYRDFHADLHPHEWHNWRDFGNGSLGNMGCHILGSVHWALRLGHPTSIEAGPINGGNDERNPVGAQVCWEYPARGDMPPVKVYWYDGIRPGTEDAGARKSDKKTRNHPPLVTELEEKFKRDFGSNGALYVGDKGYMVTGTYGDGVRIVPESQHQAYPPPPKTLPRVVGSHHDDFFRACRGEGTACSNFDVAAPLNEMILLGCLAIRAGTGRKVEWDGPNMRCANIPKLNQYLQRDNRAGWSV